MATIEILVPGEVNETIIKFPGDIFELWSQGRISEDERNKYLADFYRATYPGQKGETNYEEDIQILVQKAIAASSDQWQTNVGSVDDVPGDFTSKDFPDTIENYLPTYGSQGGGLPETSSGGDMYAQVPRPGDAGFIGPIEANAKLNEADRFQEDVDPAGVFQRFLRTDPETSGLSPSLLRYKEGQQKDVFSRHLLNNIMRTSLQGEPQKFQEFLGQGSPFDSFTTGVAINELLKNLGAGNIDELRPDTPGFLNWSNRDAAARRILESPENLSLALIQNSLSQIAPGYAGPLRRGAADIFRLYQSLNPGDTAGLIKFAQNAGYA